MQLVVVAGSVREEVGDDLVAVEMVQGAVEQPGQDVDPDLVEGRGVPGAPGRVPAGRSVDRGLGLGRGEAAGAEHGGAVLVSQAHTVRSRSALR